MYILLENTVRRGPTLRAVNIEQWVQVSDSLLQNSPPTFLLMISVVTDNHCLHLLFHCLLEIGNFLSIVYEICSIAPFSILLLALVAFSLCFSQIILSRGLSILLDQLLLPSAQLPPLLLPVSTRGSHSGFWSLSVCK